MSEGFRTPLVHILGYSPKPAGFRSVIPVLGFKPTVSGFVHPIVPLGYSLSPTTPQIPKPRPFDYLHGSLRQQAIMEDEELLIFIQAFMRCL